MSGLSGAAACGWAHWALYTAESDDAHARNGHHFMALAVENLELGDTLLLGRSGIGIATGWICRNTQAYRGLHAQLSVAVGNSVSERLTLSFRPRSSHELELLNGIAGELLAIDGASEVERCAVDAIVRVLDETTADPSHSGWRLRNSIDPSDPRERSLLGVSHGLAGFLGSLLCNGLTDRGKSVASRIANSLYHAAVLGPFGPQWPHGLGNSRTVGIGDDGFRVAWCHFSLGIAAVLWCAGRLLGEPHLCERALDSLHGIARSPRNRWGIVDFGICHGAAGAALILDHVGRNANDAALRDVAASLFSELIAGYDQELPFGYEALVQGQRYSDPSLINGVSGIVLACLTLGGYIDDSWLAAFGIPGTAQLSAQPESATTSSTF